MHITASAAAAAVSAIIRVPGDVLKHRVQAYVYPSVGYAARDVYKREGLRGLYCGLGATLLRDVPEIVIQFSLYEMLQHWAHQACQGEGAGRPSSPVLSHPVLLGAAAGALSAGLTTPLDAVKTQLQCQGVCSPASALVAIIQARGLDRKSVV